MAISSLSSSSLLLLHIDIAIGPQRLLEVFPRLEGVVELVVEEEDPREGVSARGVREGQRNDAGETVAVEIQTLEMLQLTELRGKRAWTRVSSG